MTTLYQLTIPNYSRQLGAAINILEKGKKWCEEQGKSADECMSLCLIDDMAPLITQVIFINHHTVNAVKGLFAGEFAPPKDYPEMNYDGLISYLTESKAYIDSQTESDINALANKPLIFKLTGKEIPFSMENFVQSFSLPNLYFHVATLYGLLRKEGVKLSKLDFVGEIAVGLPE